MPSHRQWGRSVTVSNRGDRISDGAYVLAQTAMHWPEEAAYQLYEDLSHSLAAPDPVVLRDANLGLVVAQVSVGTGEFPAIEEYEILRKKRSEIGEKWPAASTLIGVYFGWLYVIRAAMELFFASGRVHRNPKAAKELSVPYTRQQIEAAIMKCAREVGFWPSQWVYQEWAYISRQLARAAGQVPRIPGINQIRNRFEHFDRAVDELKARACEREETN